tara:strand:+ start:143 stop:493 length:351 start_codon:yes stop_codon:yes gene_type:complete
MNNLGIKNYIVKWVTNDMVRWAPDRTIEDYYCNSNFFVTYKEACINAVDVLPDDIFRVVEIVEMTVVPIPDYPDRTYAKPTRWHTVQNVSGHIIWNEINDSLLRLSLKDQPRDIRP